MTKEIDAMSELQQIEELIERMLNYRARRVARFMDSGDTDEACVFIELNVDKFFDVFLDELREGAGDFLGSFSATTQVGIPYTRTDTIQATVDAAVAAERERCLDIARSMLPKDHGEIVDAGRDYCEGVRDVCAAMRKGGK